MSEIMVGGRRVFVATGARTQTVNVCDANDRRGQYDWVVRLPRGSVTDAAIRAEAPATVADLIAWLTNSLGGDLEAGPPAEAAPEPRAAALDGGGTGDGGGAGHAADGSGANGGGRTARWRGYEPGHDDWLQRARAVVEREVDCLVDEFVDAPYLHRVEHSLHCRLFNMLAADPLLSDRIAVGTSRFVTQPLHKEWPETVARDACRRGNFDLAVIPPALLERVTLKEFREGRVPAPIAIEVGLDYGWAHLAADEEKLIHSGVPYGYLIHLERECALQPRVAASVQRPGGGIRTAYGLVAGGSRWRKRLAEDVIVPLA